MGTEWNRGFAWFCLFGPMSAGWIPLRLEYAPEEYQKALQEDGHGSVVRCFASHGISQRILKDLPKDPKGICCTFCFILFATPSPNLWTLEEAAAEAGSSISNASMSIFAQSIEMGRP